ncbi:hypothetical protein EW145_g1045 [Phellinidium pouzarii]|uniref:Phytocyanin domain-containing protein n=1 Tax=Phellinidium pouzarii TaxID=167371 RepID=A0A4V3XDS3_9AGAM|nr:hypothetical protein EW145_g1045 [Phellinidium pouzarii]
MKFFSLVPALAAISLVSATTFTIQVGADNSTTYTPSSISNATAGDTIAFQFMAKNHSVTQSTFASPCSASGIDSGFFPVSPNPTAIPQWSFTLENATTPLWFFCAQTGHCEAGMVFAVNPTASKTFEAFQAAANATVANSTSSAPTTPSASVVQSATAGGASNAALPKLGVSSATGLLAVLGLLAGVGL